jgi:hypothetical protein
MLTCMCLFVCTPLTVKTQTGTHVSQSSSGLLIYHPLLSDFVLGEDLVGRKIDIRYVRVKSSKHEKSGGVECILQVDAVLATVSPLVMCDMHVMFSATCSCMLA